MIDLTGQRFGHWTVISYFGVDRRRHRRWLCRCDCGTERPVVVSKIRGQPHRSCGCMRVIHGETKSKHGRTKPSKEYAAWHSMKHRCLNPKAQNYMAYGGRGISVYPPWRTSFKDFLAVLGRAPTPQHSLDRIDNNGNYEPGNVRWALAKTQSKNRRKARRRLSYDPRKTANINGILGFGA